MKNALLGSFLLAVLLSSCAHNATPTRNDLHLTEKHYTPEQMQKLLSTKTVFFYRNADRASLDSLKLALTRAWTLTPLIFADLSEYEKYGNDASYSYFVIEGISETHTSSTGSYTNTHYFLTLSINDHLDRKNKLKTEGMCRIELYPNSSSLFEGQYQGKNHNVLASLYDHGVFYNWCPVYLAGQIGAVETNLKNNFRPGFFAAVKDPSLESLLRRDTLYILNTGFMSFNKFNGREKKSEIDFSALGCPYRLCSESELYQIFETENRGRFIFEYVKSSTDKFVSIYDLKAKKLIYRVYTPVSYNLKSKDLAKILKG